MPFDEVRTRTYAVLDVGGTSIKLGAVCESSLESGAVTIGDGVPALAQADADTILRQLVTATERALACASDAGGRLSGLAIAFPGPFDLDAATPLIRGLEKFDAIHGIDLRAVLTSRLDLDDIPIAFVRDSEAVGVGEAVFGAGRNGQRVLTVALGTGLGSCLTDDGIVVERVGDQEIERLHELTTPHGRVDDVLSARGFDAVDGDVIEFGRRLGAFVDILAERFGIDLVVVAGGIAGSFERFAPGLREITEVPCLPAELGAGAALLGAARLAFSAPRAR